MSALGRKPPVVFPENQVPGCFALLIDEYGINRPPKLAEVRVDLDLAGPGAYGQPTRARQLTLDRVVSEQDDDVVMAVDSGDQTPGFLAGVVMGLVDVVNPDLSV